MKPTKGRSRVVIEEIAPQVDAGRHPVRRTMGDEITVMVTAIDPTGKIRLSRQAVLEGWTVEEALAKDARKSGPRPGGDRGRSGGDRGRSSGDRGRGGDRGGRR